MTDGVLREPLRADWPSDGAFLWAQEVRGLLTGQTNHGRPISATSHVSNTKYNLTVNNAGTGGHINVPNRFKVEDAATTIANLIVTTGVTIGTTLTVTGATVLNGAVTLGDASADTITVNGTPTFLAATTFKHNVTIQNSALTTLAAFVVTAGAQTIKLGDQTTPQIYVNVANGRVIVGSATELTTASNDRFTVSGGTAYFAGPSGSAIGIRYSAASAVGWLIGVDGSGANADLLFLDDGGSEIIRFGDTSSTYQLRVTGAIRGTTDLSIGTRAVIGGTTWNGTEELRVVGDSRFEGALVVTTGGGSVAGDFQFSNSLTVSSTLTTAVLVTTGNATIGGLLTASASVSVTGSVTASAGMSAGSSSTFTGGVTVVNTGLTISAGGADITGTLTVQNALDHNGTTWGMFGTAPTTKQTVTGTRTGTLAQLQTVVANMLTALSNYGVWTDSTT